MADKIINKPEKMSKKRKGVEKAIKILLSIVLTIFVVGLTVALWGFSGVYIYDHLFVPEYVNKTASILFFLSIFALIFFLLTLLWQQYNYRVFGKLERRAFPKPVPAEFIAGMNNTTVDDIKILQEAKTVWLK